MAITRIPTASGVAAVAALTALLNNGNIEIRTGAMPASANTAATGTVLATLQLSATAFGAPSLVGSEVVATANAVADDPAAALAGTATWFRAYASNGTTTVIDGDVSITGGGGAMILNNVAIAVNDTVTITSWKIALPISA